MALDPALPATVNGCFQPEQTKLDRIAYDQQGDGLVLTVRGGGKTLVRRDATIKWPSGEKRHMLVGERNGARVYVTRQDGVWQVVLTDEVVRLD